MKRPLIIALLAFVPLFLAVPASASGLIKAGNNLGLKAYYSFEDGAGLQATDFSGSGNTGTLTNGPAWVGGKHGKALSFDGSDDSVGLAQTNGLPIYSKTNPYSITFWVKAAGSQGACIFCESTGGSSAAIVRIMIPASGNTVQVVIRDDGSATSQNQAGNLIAFDGTWHHVVWTDSAGTAKIYVDGVLDSANFNYSPSGTFTLDTDKLGALFFNGNAGTQFLNGFLDDVRIYNRALGATEVAALYNSGGAKVNTALIGPAASNLVLWHTFDGQKLNTTTSTDSSTSGNNGTLSGGPLPKNGRLGQALVFDGTHSIALKNSLNQGSGSYTFSAWIKPSSFSGCDNSGDGCIFVSQNSGVTQGDFWFGFTSQGILTAVFIDSGPTTVARKVDTGGTIAVPGQWYHVLITWNPSGPTYAVYINGEAQPLTTLFTGSGSGGTYIGTELAGNSTYSFRGLMDDVRLYNKAFSAAEALQLYNLGGVTVNKSVVGGPGTNGLVLWHTFDGNKLNTTTSTDSSAQGNNGSLVGGPVPTRGKIGQALSFDGVGDYINVGDILNFTSSDFTFAYWVYFNSIANGPTILYKGGFNSKGYYAQVSATGQPNFQTNQSGTNQTTLADNGSITTGTWYHIVNVRSGTSVKIYINGVDRTNSAASHINPDSSTDNFQIGRYASDASLDLNGKLDDFRAYNRALSATEILQLYNAGK